MAEVGNEEEERRGGFRKEKKGEGGGEGVGGGEGLQTSGADTNTRHSHLDEKLEATFDVIAWLIIASIPPTGSTPSPLFHSVSVSSSQHLNYRRKHHRG